MDLLPAGSGEFHDGDRVLPGPVFRILQRIAVIDVEGEDFLVELDNKPVLEVSFHAAVVVGAIADDGVLVFQDFHVGTAGVSINDYARGLAVRESEAHHGGPFGRRDFGPDVMVGKVNAVVIGFCNLALMGEDAGAIVLAGLGGVPHRHQ